MGSTTGTFDEIVSALLAVGVPLLVQSAFQTSNPVADQIAVFASSKVLVAAHGAHMTNLLFLRQGDDGPPPHVVEVGFSPGWNWRRDPEGSGCEQKGEEIVFDKADYYNLARR